MQGETEAMESGVGRAGERAGGVEVAGGGVLSHGWIEGETIEAFRTRKLLLILNEKSSSSRVVNGGPALTKTRQARSGRDQKIITRKSIRARRQYFLNETKNTIPGSGTRDEGVQPTDSVSIIFSNE